MAVKGDGVDLAIMALEDMDAAPFGDAPYPCGGVVTAGNNNVAPYLEATDTSLMPDEDVSAVTGLDVPNPESRISRAGNGSSRIRHLQAPDCRRVAPESVHTSTI